MLDNAALPDNQLSKEDYLLLRAKEALSTDIYAAKSWLITARSLFPHSAKVQFEAYQIEKLSKNVKEAAKCFSEIFQNFPENREIWAEIEAVTACLRSDQVDSESNLLCQMFQHIPQDLQHRLLVMTADHSEDTMEHCKLLLLLLRRFPKTAATHGPRLVETLLTAEKHSHPGQSINDFRRLLACETVPLLGSSRVDLNQRLAYRLICKVTEFYLAYIMKPPDSQIQQPWERLFQVLELLGKKMGWELSGLFATPWNHEFYCERLQQFATTHSSSLTDESIVRQLLVCSTIIMLRMLNEHTAMISNDDVNYVLVEAFVTNPPAISSTEPKLKKRKREEPPGVVLTTESEYSGSGLSYAITLWDLSHSTEHLQREQQKINQQMNLERWIKQYQADICVYKGLHPDALVRFGREADLLVTNIRIASTFFAVKDYKSMLDYIVVAANNLPPNRGQVSKNLSVPATRHLHFLPLARIPILQYCSRLILEAIKDAINVPGVVGDWAIGNALVLMQIDWPQESQLLSVITERIIAAEAFRYPLFQPYIICIDILEELMYLWTEHGGGVALEITGNTDTLQRSRITTRGADKGVREEVKQAMRRQAARDGVEPIDELIQRFLVNEKAALLHTLIIP